MIIIFSCFCLFWGFVCLFFCYFFKVKFYCRIDGTLLVKLAVPLGTFNFYFLMVKTAKFMCLSVPFLIIPRAPTIIIISFKVHTFPVYISGSLYLLILLFSLTDML